MGRFEVQGRVRDVREIIAKLNNLPSGEAPDPEIIQHWEGRLKTLQSFEEVECESTLQDEEKGEGD